MAEHSVSEESSDEANKTVLAKEKSPDIREAKYIRNPTSEYIAKTPTVSDYVNSTWKPDEYSKANTAKIVESDKFIEPYKMAVDATDGNQTTRVNVVPKSCDVPPAPPPYHIAAAFSKKAALFQQFNNRTLLSKIKDSKYLSTFLFVLFECNSKSLQLWKKAGLGHKSLSFQRSERTRIQLHSRYLSTRR